MSGVQTYYEKPIEIEALYYDGENVEEVAEFVKEALLTTVTNVRFINTVMGMEFLLPDVYIVKDHIGSISLIQPSIFEKKYAVV